MSTCIQEGTDNKSIKEINGTLKELSEKLQESNSSSKKLNNTMLLLTGVGVSIAIIEFISKLLPNFF